jgi:O-antigen ligase
MNAIRRFLLGVIVFDIPFHADVELGYRHGLAELNALGGLDVSLTTACLALLYALWFVDATSSASRPRTTAPVGWPLTIYVLIAGLSIGVASDRALASFEVWVLLQTFLLYVYLVKHVCTRRDVAFIATVLLCALLVESCVMIGLRALGHGIQLGPFNARVDPDMRVGGTVGSPNTAGAYVSLLLAPCLGYLIVSVSRRQKLLAILAFIVGGLALAVTLSRGGWVAGAVSLGLFCTLAWWRGWLKARVLFAFTATCVLAVGLFHTALHERFVSDDKGAARARVPLMKLACRMAVDHPILGVGSNNFAVAMSPYTGHPELRNEWLHTVHNKYLLVLVETGALGLLAFLWFLATVVSRGLRVSRLGDTGISPLALGFTAGIVGQMAHMTVELYHSRPQLQLLWMVAGLIVVMSHVVESTAEETEGQPHAVGENLAPTH